MLKNIVRAVKRVMTSLNEASLADGISRVISGRVEKSSTSNGVNLPENLSDEQVNQLTKDGLVEMKKKVKLVKYAILLAYQGKNYFGMQVSIFQAFLPERIEDAFLDSTECDLSDH